MTCSTRNCCTVGFVAVHAGFHAHRQVQFNGFLLEYFAMTLLTTDVRRGMARMTEIYEFRKLVQRFLWRNLRIFRDGSELLDCIGVTLDRCMTNHTLSFNGEQCFRRSGCRLVAEGALLYVRMLFMAEIERNIRCLCRRLCRLLGSILRKRKMGHGHKLQCHQCQAE